MPRAKSDQPPKTVQCSGVDEITGYQCLNRVNVRRPSEGGLHFCPARACQAYKQRVYEKRRAKKMFVDQLEQTRRFVHYAVWIPRVQCQLCGLENAIDGYAHRDGAGGACLGVGDRPDGAGGEFFDIFHPELKPGYEA
jgi:hypothetical protein